jgi:hypothetical protein
MEALVKRLMIPLVVLGACFLAAATTDPKKVAPGKLVLMGQSAKAANGSLEVRLLWMPTQGWLPAGGVNVYRQLPGKGEELIGKRIAAVQGFIKPETLTKLNDAGSAGSDTFAGSIAKILSTKAVFKGIKTDVGTLLQQRVPPVQMRQMLLKTSTLAAHLRSLKPGTAIKGSAVNTKGQVLVQALVNPELSAKLGLSFTDTAVAEGQAITYTLRAVDANGSEDHNPIAEAKIVVSANAVRPPPPVDLDGFQLDQSTADLHWEAPTGADQSSLGLVSYRIVRVDTQNANGVTVNSSPVLIASQETVSGEHVAVPTTFRDSAAPLGSVTYHVFSEDAFGRESEPASLTLNMADLRVPNAVTHVVARLDQPNYMMVAGSLKQNQVIHVFFGGDLMTLHLATGYHVFRTDADLGPSSTTELTTGPISGTPAPQQALHLQDLIDLFGLQQVLSAGGASMRTTYNSTPQTQWLAKYGPQTITQIQPSPALSTMAGHVLMVDDPSPALDHYFSYSVTAEYTQVGRQSLPRPSRNVGVPLLVPPPRPAAPQGAFTLEQGNFGYLDPSSGNPTTGPSGMKAGASTIKALAAKVLPSTKRLTTKRFALDESHFTHASTGIVGGSVSLTWQSVTQTKAMRYAVYRASATGMFLTANAGPPPSTGPGASLHVSSTLAGGATYQFYFNAPNIPPANWVKLTETSKLAYLDVTPRSHAQVFAYRVVAINRWGIASEVSPQLRVTLKATLPPSVPAVAAIGASDNGGVNVVWTPNSSEEQVNQYAILRVPTITLLDELLGANAPVAQARVLRKPKVDIAGGLGSSQIATGPRAIHSLQTLKKFGVSLKVSEASILQGLIAQSNVGGRKTTVVGGGGTNASTNLKAISTAIASLNSYEVVGTVKGVDPASTAQITYNDATAQPEVEYLYRVVAICTDNIASDGSIPTDGMAMKVKADPPTAVTPSFDTSSRSAKLSWTAPSSGAGSYFVTRQAVTGTTPTGPVLNLGVLTGSPPPTTLADPYVRTGQSYIYSVMATDSLGHVSVVVQSAVLGPIPPVASNSDTFKPGTASNSDSNGGTSGTGTNGGANGDDPASIAAYFTGTLPATTDGVYNKGYRILLNTIAIVLRKTYYRDGNLAWGTPTGYNGTFTSGPGQHLLMLDFWVKNVSASNITTAINDYIISVTMSDGTVYVSNTSVVKDTLKDFRLDLAPEAKVHLLSAIPVPSSLTPTRISIRGNGGIATEWDMTKNAVSTG